MHVHTHKHTCSYIYFNILFYIITTFLPSTFQSWPFLLICGNCSLWCETFLHLMFSDSGRLSAKVCEAFSRPFDTASHTNGTTHRAKHIQRHQFSLSVQQSEDIHWKPEGKILWHHFNLIHRHSKDSYFFLVLPSHVDPLYPNFTAHSNSIDTENVVWKHQYVWIKHVWARTSVLHCGLTVLQTTPERFSWPWWGSEGKMLCFPGWMESFRYGSGLKNIPFFKPTAWRSDRGGTWKQWKSREGRRHVCQNSVSWRCACSCRRAELQRGDRRHMLSGNHHRRVSGGSVLAAINQ